MQSDELMVRYLPPDRVPMLVEERGRQEYHQNINDNHSFETRSELIDKDVDTITRDFFACKLLFVHRKGDDQVLAYVQIDRIEYNTRSCELSIIVPPEHRLGLGFLCLQKAQEFLYHELNFKCVFFQIKGGNTLSLNTRKYERLPNSKLRMRDACYTIGSLREKLLFTETRAEFERKRKRGGVGISARLSALAAPRDEYSKLLAGELELSWSASCRPTDEELAQEWQRLREDAAQLVAHAGAALSDWERARGLELEERTAALRTKLKIARRSGRQVQQLLEASQEVSVELARRLGRTLSDVVATLDRREADMQTRLRALVSLKVAMEPGGSATRELSFEQMLHAPAVGPRRRAIDEAFSAHGSELGRLSGEYDRVGSDTSRSASIAERLDLPAVMVGELTATDFPQLAEVWDLYRAVHAREVGGGHHFSDRLYAGIEWPKGQLGIRDGLRLVFNAAAPLGSEVQRVLYEVIRDGRLRVDEAGTGVCFASYTVKPHVATYWNGSARCLFTLAHELGHAVHHALSVQHNALDEACYPAHADECFSLFFEHLLARFLRQTGAYLDARSIDLLAIESGIDLLVRRKLVADYRAARADGASTARSFSTFHARVLGEDAGPPEWLWLFDQSPLRPDQTYQYIIGHAMSSWLHDAEKSSVQQSVGLMKAGSQLRVDQLDRSWRTLFCAALGKLQARLESRL